jgi:uncharacterized protein (DUF427 family)
MRLISPDQEKAVSKIQHIKIIHKASQTLLAEGELGREIAQIEGNYYCQRSCVNLDCFKTNFIPGICIYKFIYVWNDLIINGVREKRFFSWTYWIPNPLLPNIWFRIAIPGGEAELEYICSD